ncbi:MAG: nucleotidyltransferase domain-containing protein [Betaproteobacteria bacterium]
MDNQALSIAEALFGKTQQAVLALLFGQLDRSFYLRQISVIAGTGASQVQKELDNLTRAGLILREPRGNQVWFQANPRSPIFLELKSLVAKTFGIADVVRETLAPFARKIRIAFIFGSVARAEHDSSSDVDVLVVGQFAPSKLAPAQVRLNEVLGRRVSFVVYDEAGFQKHIAQRDPFLGNVLTQPRIWLVGTDANLANLDGIPPRKPGREKAA